MKPFAFKNLPLIATALALALSGCLGGGGGSSTPKSFATLGGNAVKGIIKNGNVKAEELNTDKTVKAQVGTATTGADGSYELKVSTSYAGGPIQITVSADANTEMKCDIPAGCGTTVNFGNWYKPGAGNLTMTALVAEAASGASIGVNVTPYTDLAARRAKQNASLDASAVNVANSEVNNLLGGIDILNIKPLDITDPTATASGSPAQKAYAAYSAAIGALADASSGSPNINAALETLANSFADGTIMADDGGSNDAVFSLQEIINGAKSALTEAGTTDTSGTIAALQDDVDNAGGGNVDPEADPTASDTPLVKVKAFVTDVRTWGTVIDSETKAKGDAFDAQANLASDAANMSGELIMSPALEASIKAIVYYYDGTETSTDLLDYSLGFDSGTIGKSGNVFTITNGVIGGATVNITAEIPADGMTATSFTIGITSATIESDAMDAAINSGSVTLTTKTAYTLDVAAMDAGTATVPDISGGSLDLDVSLTQKQDTNGDPLAATVTFAGALQVSLVNAQKDSMGNYNWITPKTLSLTGGVSTSDGNSLEFSLTAEVTNANTFTPVGGLAKGTIKHNLVTWTYSGDTFTATTPKVTLTVTRNASNGSASYTETWSDGYSNGPYSLGGSYTTINDAVYDAVNYYSYLYSDLYYTMWVDGEGGYDINSADIQNANFSQNGSLSGKLVDPYFVVESSSKWLDATVGLSFHLQLTGLPEAYVTISADRTAYESGTGTITIAYGTRQIVISGTATNTTTTGTMTITNQNGVTMVITGDLENGPGYIKYNGTTYATMARQNGIMKITYTDGDFVNL